MQSYITILKLDVKHSYYTSGWCTDLSFSPTPETQNLIKGHRLLVKYRPAGLEVYAPLDSDNNNLLIPVEQGLLFQWLVRPATDTFYVVTALPLKDHKGIYLISNQAQGITDPADFDDYGGLIDSSGTELSKSFGSLPLFTTELELVKDVSDQVIILNPPPVAHATLNDFAFEKGDPGESFDPHSDLSRWRLMNQNTIQLSGKLEKDVVIKISYPVPVKGGQNSFAMLNIKVKQPFTQKANPALVYTLNLEAKKVRWQYLILTRNTNGFSLKKTEKWQLKISEVEKHPVSIIELNNTTSPSPDNTKANLVWERLKSTIDLTANTEGKVFFITTKNPVPFQEKLLTDISIQTESEEDVITGLRNPLGLDNGFQLVRNSNLVTNTAITL